MKYRCTGYASLVSLASILCGVPALASDRAMQGESDSETVEMAEAYEANLKLLVAGVRKDTGQADLPIVMGRISSSLLKKTPWNFDQAKTVQAAQEAVAAQDKQVHIINTDQLSTQKDNTHFDTKAQLTLGGQMAGIMIRVLSKEAKPPKKANYVRNWPFSLIDVKRS